MDYRLGLDVGTNSIGIGIAELKDGLPVKLIDGYVRLFSDGRTDKEKTSKAVSRRQARQARRNRDRKKRRINNLVNHLRRFGYFPKNEKDSQELKDLEPLSLRSKALDGKIDKFEIGRALIHISQRRGFKSGRKEQKDNDHNKLTDRITELQKNISETESNTLGRYLYNEHLSKGLSTRCNLETDLYTLRSMYIHEFNEIRIVQQKAHNEADKFWDEAFQIIFHQRPLRTPIRGKCPIYHESPRTLRSTYSFQKYRILADLANLAIINDLGQTREIPEELKLKIYNTLLSAQKMSFSKMSKICSLSTNEKFNLESSTRKNLEGNYISTQLINIMNEHWEKWSDSEKDDFIIFMLEAKNDEEIVNKFSEKYDEDIVKQLIELDYKELEVEKGTSRYSIRALQEINSEMAMGFKSPMTALKSLYGGKESKATFDNLKYYAEVIPETAMNFIQTDKPIDQKLEEEIYGKIGNPTVHIALNQIRKVVNEVINKHGLPKEVSVEVTRDLALSKQDKLDLNKFQKSQKNLNDEAKAQFASVSGGKEAQRADIIKYKLWKELPELGDMSRACPYTGKIISLVDLYSSEVEIEHILPFAQTLDDSFNNKTVSYAKANSDKGNRSPYQAFSEDLRLAKKYNYDEILERAKVFSKDKRKRFYAGALAEAGSENKWLARQLNDTAYIAKVTKKYLMTVCPKTIVVRGQMTSMLRYHWGVQQVFPDPEDKRSDNRHHAVDALTLSLINTAMIQKLNKQIKFGKIRRTKSNQNVTTVVTILT